MSAKPRFEDFARARAQAMARTAWLLTGESHAAQDLVQETLVKVYINWGRVSRAEDPAKYARAIMTNTYLSSRRKSSSREVPTERVDARLQEPADVSQHLDLVRALGTLTRVDRATLVLRYYDGLSAPEVAAELGLTPGAVRNRCMRALAQVRTAMGIAPTGTEESVTRSSAVNHGGYKHEPSERGRNERA